MHRLRISNCTFFFTWRKSCNLDRKEYCATYVYVSAPFYFAGWLWCSIVELKARNSLFTNSVNCFWHKQQDHGTLGHWTAWNIATWHLNLPKNSNFRKGTHLLQAVAPAVNKFCDLSELLNHVSNLFLHSLPVQITWNITTLIFTEWNA